jgi:hypothetical protein
MFAPFMHPEGKLNRDQRLGYQTKTLSVTWGLFLRQDLDGFMRCLCAVTEIQRCLAEPLGPFITDLSRCHLLLQFSDT